jgi:hypothetical protein
MYVGPDLYEVRFQDLNTEREPFFSIITNPLMLQTSSFSSKTNPPPHLSRFAPQVSGPSFHQHCSAISTILHLECCSICEALSALAHVQLGVLRVLT